MSMNTVDILGLGESVALYQRTLPDFMPDNLTIGVNDIWSKYKTDIVVCVDTPERFTADRLKVIRECKPRWFFSHLEHWQFKPGYQQLTLLAKAKEITLELARGFKYTNEWSGIPQSNNSPFIACIIAYLFEADHIRLFGVDLNTHPKLSRPDMINITLSHYEQLYRLLKAKGVMLTCCKGSRLQSVMPTHE